MFRCKVLDITQVDLVWNKYRIVRAFPPILTICVSAIGHAMSFMNAFWSKHSHIQIPTRESHHVMEIFRMDEGWIGGCIPPLVFVSIKHTTIRKYPIILARWNLVTTFQDVLRSLHFIYPRNYPEGRQLFAFISWIPTWYDILYIPRRKVGWVLPREHVFCNGVHH